jgi:hypothetical protein
LSCTSKAAPDDQGLLGLLVGLEQEGGTMGLIMAFVAGFIVGGRGGNEGLDEVVAALQAVRESQEVEDLLVAVRSHASHALQEVGKWLEPGSEPISMGTILERARAVVQRDPKASAS